MPELTTKDSNPLIVEPHMIERVIAGYFDHVNREHRPEQRWEEQKGWIARRGSLTAWSMNRDAACTMLGFMEGRRSCA